MPEDQSMMMKMLKEAVQKKTKGLEQGLVMARVSVAE